MAAERSSSPPRAHTTVSAAPVPGDGPSLKETLCLFAHVRCGRPFPTLFLLLSLSHPSRPSSTSTSPVAPSQTVLEHSLSPHVSVLVLGAQLTTTAQLPGVLGSCPHARSPRSGRGGSGWNLGILCAKSMRPLIATLN